MSEKKSLNRRRFVQGSLAAAAMVPLGGALASCATGGGNDTGGDGGGGSKAATGARTSADNPFGIEAKSSIDAVIFKGGYGLDYVTFAGNLLTKKFPSVDVKVSGTTQMTQHLQPRFVAGNPPDLVDNAGAGQIPFISILGQLETLDDVYAAKNYEGTPIEDTVYPGVKASGTFDGKLVAMNYTMAAFGVWYSASLFKKNGWEPPRTWDDVVSLGAKSKSAGKYLFVWGKEAATYYQTLAIDSAIKQGGSEVRVKLGGLTKDCWSQDPIQKVFQALEECVTKGYFVPGGAGEQFTKAQTRWSLKEEAVLYPCGSWIENEMKKATKDGFQMTGVPEPVMDPATSKMPYEAMRVTQGQSFIVPSEGKNPAGGKELLRAMFSKESVNNFSKTQHVATVVKGVIPEDAYGSSGLASLIRMMDGAASNVFNYPVFGAYGMNTDQLTVWNSFLSGKIDAKGLTDGLQKITDKVRNDPSIKKLPVQK